VASAEQHGHKSESLRDLFRRLARTLHPDRAQEDAERERLTGIMKEVTSAYQNGDLARLLVLEETWAKHASLPVADDEQRCRELERLNRALRAQLAGVNRELRQLKRSAKDAAFDMPLEAALDGAEHEIAELTSIRDFVREFRDGKISLRRFVHGPEQATPEDLDLDALAYELAQALMDDRVAPSPSRRRKRKGTKQSR
jgi:hypothetical protein